MGPQEQQTIQTVAQAASDPYVTWQIFKYALGLALAYTTFSYALMWKLFLLMRDERKDASEGRDKLWQAIDAVKTNELKHINDEIAELKAKVK